MIRTDGEPTIAWADPPCCGDPGDCSEPCSAVSALDDTAIENVTQVYYDGEGNAAFRDEVLS